MKKMKKVLLFTIFMIVLLTVGCSTKDTDKSSNTADTTAVLQVTDEPSKEPTEHVEVLVAAAASLQNAMEELQTLYKEVDPNVTLTFTFGSSGTLQQQIEQGAPVDVFMSAALKQMKTLEDGGFLLDGTKKELLENKVVLIVPKDSNLNISSFKDILKASIIALGEPSSVPVGQYSEEIFTSLGILEQVKEKVTYGKDVTEVLTWTATGNADAGVVYATDAKWSEDVTIVAEAAEGSSSKVIYPVAVVKDTKVETAAKAFVEYLASDEAIDVFELYGFTSNQ